MSERDKALARAIHETREQDYVASDDMPLPRVIPALILVALGVWCWAVYRGLSTFASWVTR